MGHQLIYNKSHFTEKSDYKSKLGVHPSLVSFQLCCHPSKTTTATLLMDYQKAIIKCSLMDLWALNLWHTHILICQKEDIKFAIRFLDSTVKSTFSCCCGSKIVCVCVCHYIVSVSINSALTFDVSHLFTLALPGLLWKQAYLLNFHRRQKLVITFPGCHHFIEIHHYLVLFGYIEPSDGDRHC